MLISCAVTAQQINKIFFLMQRLIYCIAVSKELARTATGRLNNGVSQVPPMRGESDLDSFRQTLPIYQYREEILEAIGQSQVTLVSGETGSGKTTQVQGSDCHTGYTETKRQSTNNADEISRQ